jgi:hypothetical protein
MTFQNMKWKDLQPRLTWTGTTMGKTTGEIGIQMTVTGNYRKKWFQPPPDSTMRDHSSKPLSQLDDDPYGGPLGKIRGDAGGLPAFAVFSFDGSSQIRQLQIYLDRYALMQSITAQPGDWDPDADAFDASAFDAARQSAKQERRVIHGAKGRRITITIED